MRRINIFLLFFISFSYFACRDNKITVSENAMPGKIYEFYSGNYKGFSIWIVNGDFIRREIFNEFIYGGNDERYTFVPDSEIWIDNSISADEYLTTLEHEIIEQKLMRFNGYTYYDAHDSALMLELGMRRSFLTAAREHEKRIPLVSPTDFDSTQEIEELPEYIKLEGVYKIPFGLRDGREVWIVDGYKIRREIYPDFGFSGNSAAYHFIPENEIWIDASVSCRDIEYSIQLEMKEMDYMLSGLSYDDAYLNALKTNDSLRKVSANLIIRKSSFKLIENKYRDTGTGATVKNK